MCIMIDIAVCIKCLDWFIVVLWVVCCLCSELCGVWSHKLSVSSAVVILLKYWCIMMPVFIGVLSCLALV